MFDLSKIADEIGEKLKKSNPLKEITRVTLAAKFYFHDVKEKERQPAHDTLDNHRKAQAYYAIVTTDHFIKEYFGEESQ